MSRLRIGLLLAGVAFLGKVAPAQEPIPSSSASLPSANQFLPERAVDSGWPFVRGPGFDGHSAEINLADGWSEDGPPVVWTRPVGQGYSAFVAFGDSVCTQTQTLSGQYVECLDADTGMTRWSHRYDWPYDPAGVYPGPRATPTYAEGRIVYAGPDGLTGCLDAETGREFWSVNVLQKYDGQGVGFGYACSPTIVERLVLLPVGGEGASMVALDLMSGDEVWKSGNEPASYTPAFPIQFHGQPLVVGYLQNALTISDRTTGAQLGSFDLSRGYDEHSAWPIYQEPHLWISGPFRSGSQLLSISEAVATDADAPTDSLKLTTVWKERSLSNDVTSSVLVDGYLYGFDIFDAQSKTHRPSRGMFRCVDFLTGEVKWSIGSGRPHREDSSTDSEPREPEVGQCGIVVADGKLIVLNELGELLLIRPNPNRYEELARTTVLGGELVWTPPILHRGRVYLRNHSQAVCVFVGEPSLLQPTYGPLLSVRDVPQTPYRNLAELILPIEPEYAFDVPSSEWLWNWYVASMAMLVVAFGAGKLLSMHLPSPLCEQRSARAFLTIAFGFGSSGTTVLSAMTGEFYFTWMLCVFVVFDAVAGTLRWTRGRSLYETAPTGLAVKADGPRHELLSVAGLLLTLLGYFLLCRRFSLVYQWIFLAGLPAALPFSSLAGWFRNRSGPMAPYSATICSLLAFSSMYVFSVEFLRWRY